MRGVFAFPGILNLSIVLFFSSHLVSLAVHQFSGHHIILYSPWVSYDCSRVRGLVRNMSDLIGLGRIFPALQ